MPKFRILRGHHTEGTHENSAPIVYHKNDVVDSKANLLLLNKIDSVKFAEVSENTPTTYEGGKPLGSFSKASALAVEEVESDGLEELTVIKLKELAAEEEIELDMTMRKDEIVNSIRIARDLSS